MADKQFAFGGTRNASYVEEDDPLAELARIVGYQEQPAVPARADHDEPVVRREPVVAEFPSVVQSVAPPVLQNPVADLEDELLRAFETYDDPRSGEPSAVHQEVAAQPAALDRAAAYQPANDIQDEDDPFGALAAVVAATAPNAYPASQQAAARTEPTFSSSEPAAAQPQRRSLATPLAPRPAAEPVAVSPVAQPAAAPEPEFSVDLLEAELMSSLDEAPAVAYRPNAQPAAASVSAPDSGRREPAFDSTPASDPRDSWNSRVEPQASAARAETSRSAADDMDALLNDVARYAVPGTSGQAERREPAFDASLAAISGLANPFAPAAPANTGYQTFSPSSLAPVAVPDRSPEQDLSEMFTAADFELDIDELEQQLTDLSFDDEPVITPPETQAEPRREAFADFAPESSGHVETPFVAQREEPRVDTPSEPVFTFETVDIVDVEPEPEPEDIRPAYEPRERSQSVAAPVPFTPSAYSAPTFEPAYQPAQTTASVIDYNPEPHGPFDPAMLAEAEDPVEALGEIDVPELEVHEPEEPAVVVPDYDLDIDAEMANLFNSLPAMSTSTSAETSAVQPPHAAVTDFDGRGSRASAEAFDEFERALEDDFRTMLNQPLGQPRTVSGMPIQPQQGMPVASNTATLRSILLAACATGAIALVGLGGYMALTHRSGASSGAPRIIAADKGPVKVVPEDKGGVTVPNQDKAVYDRVAGHEADAVKQGSLVTTEEQPVDVVQKTLVPDSAINAEAEQDTNTGVASTPVEDTKDARLLPTDAKPVADAQPAAATTAPAGVAVRKVKTMIVKADGTLVPREEAAPATDATVTSTASATDNAVALPASAPSAPVAAATTTTPAAAPADISAAAPAEPAATTPAPALRSAAAETPATPAAAPAVPADTTASDASLASVANSEVPTTAPVRVVKTAKVTDSAPIPAARPSEQPVNVVGTVTASGRVKPGAAAPETPQETALATPAAAKPAASGTYGIQIASLPSEADAKASIAKFSTKFSGVLGGHSIGIRKADIPGKGTYYRLRVDVGSKEQANALCAKLKASGGSCLVSK